MALLNRHMITIFRKSKEMAGLMPFSSSIFNSINPLITFLCPYYY